MTMTSATDTAPAATGTVAGSAAVGLPRRSWVEHVMGLPISVHVRGDAATSAGVERAVCTLYESLRQVDERFSPYRPDSEVSAIRRGEPPTSSAELLEIRALCAEARRRTDGAFDAELPGGFDPSGLVKGWAVERATGPLREAAAGSDWLVNAGGDILLHAEPGRSWQVGVEDPGNLNRTLRTFALSHGAIATSGDARRGAHITDPRTGRPADSGMLSATVIAPTLLRADVYATAAYVRGLASLPWLVRERGVRVLFVRADGSRVSTLSHPKDRS